MQVLILLIQFYNIKMYNHEIGEIECNPWKSCNIYT